MIVQLDGSDSHLLCESLNISPFCENQYSNTFVIRDTGPVSDLVCRFC